MDKHWKEADNLHALMIVKRVITMFAGGRGDN